MPCVSVRPHHRLRRMPFALLIVFLCNVAPRATFAETPNGQAGSFRKTVRPILVSYCYDCHADGADEGGFVFDAAETDRELIGDRELWLAVLRNLRAGIMPPVDQERPTRQEQREVTDWIKTAVFGVDAENRDPGRVTVRRLNRAEYRNTIRDLMGIDFNAEIFFPPDDTGFGFDNVGDVLSLSPLLLEKYLQAAEQIVSRAVPIDRWVIPTQTLSGDRFVSADESLDGSNMSFDVAATVSHTVQIETAGRYSLDLEVEIDGTFNYDPSRCRVTFLADGKKLSTNQYAWENDKKIQRKFVQDWDAGPHRLTFQLEPIEPTPIPPGQADDEDDTSVSFDIIALNVVGPEAPQHWIHPANYDRFFTRDEPPLTPKDSREYAREILDAFTRRAYRRPANDLTLQRLVRLAEFNYVQPDKTFEIGIAQAMTAVLASPRFLFRLEDPNISSDDKFPLIDEYALATRLSYFLWSSMPDDRLFELADQGRLRENLDQEIERMIQDDRFDEFVINFVGQWLRARDAEHVQIDPLSVAGVREEYDQLRLISKRRYLEEDDPNFVSEEEWDQQRDRYLEIRRIRQKLDTDVRIAMRRETEMMFGYIVRNDRSLLELLDSNYTFLNEGLANLYEIPGVEGNEMRRVELASDSPRGGVLTQATMLTVTSNPTRTSPVKRGLYILENILGTPAPPAPGGVPELEEAAKQFGDREPTLREILAAHREAPLCASCHARMDPLGLALENFDALGSWREQENGQPIDATGELITGETFNDVRDLKKILVDSRRGDFYRCVTQKMLTYALGRGVEYHDEYTIDEIAENLESGGGRFGVLLREVIRSPAFQRQRRPDANPRSAQ